MFLFSIDQITIQLIINNRGCNLLFLKGKQKGKQIHTNDFNLVMSRAASGTSNLSVQYCYLSKQLELLQF